MKQIEIYTDGACSGNPGPGGWGAILLFVRRRKRTSRSFPAARRNTTNNRMEMTALLRSAAPVERALRHRFVQRQPVCHQRAGKRLGQGAGAPAAGKKPTSPPP